MTQAQTDKLLKELSQASVILAVFAGLPYSLGTAADVLPPDVKKWVTLGSAFAAALLKTIQLLVNALTPPPPDAVNTPPSPSATKLPLVILAGLCMAVAGNYARATDPIPQALGAMPTPANTILASGFTQPELDELARLKSEIPPPGIDGYAWRLEGERFKRALRIYEIETIAWRRAQK